MPAGRPIEFSDEVVKKAEKYLLECVLKAKDPKAPVDLPGIEGLALYLEIARPTVYDWASKYEEFSYIVEKIMATQAKMLQGNGLGGTYNASITKLMLTKHGYRDEAGVDLSNKGEKFNTLPPHVAEIVAKAEEELKKKL